MLNYDNDSTINDIGRHYSSAFRHITAAGAAEDVQCAAAVKGALLFYYYGMVFCSKLETEMLIILRIV